MSITYLKDQSEEYQVIRKPNNMFPRSRTGYGAKIKTDYCVKMRNRLYRVYATCYSNCASLWILAGGKTLHLSEADTGDV